MGVNSNHAASDNNPDAEPDANPNSNAKTDTKANPDPGANPDPTAKPEALSVRVIVTCSCSGHILLWRASYKGVGCASTLPESILHNYFFMSFT